MADLDKCNYGHLHSIEKLCRICGCTLTGKSTYKVAEYSIRLTFILNINFGTDV